MFHFSRLLAVFTVTLVAAVLLPACRKAPGPSAATPSPSPTPVAEEATPEPSKFQRARVAKRGPIIYPQLANLNRIEGIVSVRFNVGADGKPTSVGVARSSGSLMLDSVVRSPGMMEWTFHPATVEGKAIPSTLDQTMEFRLDPGEQRKLAEKRLAAPVGLPDAPYPEVALTMKPRPSGDVTVGVFWTPNGLVDIINLVKDSGSPALNYAAIQWAYENWHLDPKEVPNDQKEQFTKVVRFRPPVGDGTSNATPPPLSTATP